MARNKINDLRNHLFAQLERLSEDEMTPEQLDIEIKKSKATALISQQILNSAKLEIEYLKVQTKAGERVSGPKFLNEGE